MKPCVVGKSHVKKLDKHGWLGSCRNLDQNRCARLCTCPTITIIGGGTPRMPPTARKSFRQQAISVAAQGPGKISTSWVNGIFSRQALLRPAVNWPYLSLREQPDHLRSHPSIHTARIDSDIEDCRPKPASHRRRWRACTQTSTSRCRAHTGTTTALISAGECWRTTR